MVRRSSGGGRVDGGKAKAADGARVDGEPGDDAVGVVEVGARELPEIRIGGRGGGLAGRMPTTVRHRVGRCRPCSFVSTHEHASPEVNCVMEH